MSQEQKIPFYQTITNFVDRQIGINLEQIGYNIPCTVEAIEGSIVTVNFELTSIPYTLPKIKMPVVGFEYIRYPIQVGDRGFTVSATASIAGLTGLGTGVADLTNTGNLSMLAFVPLGCTNFFAVNPNYLVMYGQEGVEIRNKSGSVTLKLNDTGVTIDLGGGLLKTINGNVEIDGNLLVTGSITGRGGMNITGTTGGSTMTINGDINSTGTITNNGVPIDSTHRHGGVMTGGGSTGTPI
jgi:hypothetical protein